MPYAIGPLYVCLSVCDVGVLWPNGEKDQDATWYCGRPWPRPRPVRWGLSSTQQKRHNTPEFLAHACCGQTLGGIKMPLGTDAGPGLGYMVSDGHPAPSPRKKGHDSPPHFSAHVYRGQTVAHLSNCCALVPAASRRFANAYRARPF